MDNMLILWMFIVQFNPMFTVQSTLNLDILLAKSNPNNGTRVNGA